jgi:hypothetical protein
MTLRLCHRSDGRLQDVSSAVIENVALASTWWRGSGYCSGAGEPAPSTRTKTKGSNRNQLTTLRHKISIANVREGSTDKESQAGRDGGEAIEEDEGVANKAQGAGF